MSQDKNSKAGGAGRQGRSSPFVGGEGVSSSGGQPGSPDVVTAYGRRFTRQPGESPQDFGQRISSRVPILAVQRITHNADIPVREAIRRNAESRKKK